MKFCFHIVRVIFYFQKKLALLTVNRLSNNLLQRDLGIKPIISNFVELLPKFGYFFFLIIVHTFFFFFFCFAFVVGFVRVIVK